jgi:hypothetical protein
MQVGLFDTRLNPVDTIDGVMNEGIALIINGEPGDKYPQLRIVVSEKDVPDMRLVWEQGKVLTVLDWLSSDEQRKTHELMWEIMLTVDGATGDFARARQGEL